MHEALFLILAIEEIPVQSDLEVSSDEQNSQKIWKSLILF